VLRVYEQEITSLRALRQAFVENKLLDVEIVVVSSLLNALPLVVFGTPGTRAPLMYFADTQFWFCLGLLLAYWPRFRRLFGFLKRDPARSGAWRNIQVRYALPLLVLSIPL
jgi:hypothetical protein